MVDNKTIEEQIIFRVEESIKIDIIRYSKFELISDVFCAIRPYKKSNGSDTNSLKYELIEIKGCLVDKDDAFEFSYNYDEQEAVLYWDKSKITPIADSGYIIVELSANYNFKKNIKIPWKINKIDVLLSADDMEIVKRNNDYPSCQKFFDIAWENCKEIELLSFKIHRPKDVEKNGFWYNNDKCPKITIDYSPTFLGNKLEFYINNFNNEFEYDKEYKIKCKCNNEIDKTAYIYNIGLLLKGNNILLLSENISLKFIPQCIVTKKNNTNHNIDSYTLGNDNSTIINISLENNANNDGPIAKIWITFTCEEFYKSLFVLNENNKHITIEPKQSKTIILSLNKEFLKIMPQNDITATLKLEAGNDYTIFDTYEEKITLKI